MPIFSRKKYKTDPNANTGVPAEITTGNLAELIDLTYKPEEDVGHADPTANLEHLVFMVKYTNGTRSLLKAEQMGTPGVNQVNNLEIAGLAMELVDSKLTKPVAITDGERAALREACRTNKINPAHIATVLKNALSAKVQSKSGAERGGASNIWIKMGFMPGVTDATKISGAQVINNLTTKGGMKQLGMIVAVDLFNNNSDRFSHDGKLSNTGNLLFSDKKARGTGKGKVTGLDYFTAFSPGANVTNDPQFLEDNYTIDDQWMGRALKSSASIRQYADALCNDLNTKFGTPGKKLGTFNKWNLRKGMEEGCDVMKKKLKSKVMASNNISPKYKAALVARMKWLGWPA